MDEQREKDIQLLCSAVLDLSVELNHNSSYNNCPLCLCQTAEEEMVDVNHHHNCAYLIAKDLSTKQ